jgi:hypothetical protein
VTSKIWQHFPRSKNEKISQIDTFLKKSKIFPILFCQKLFWGKKKLKKSLS